MTSEKDDRALARARRIERLEAICERAAEAARRVTECDDCDGTGYADDDDLALLCRRCNGTGEAAE